MKKKINRRDFLKVMGVVGMTASLAACGDSGSSSAAASSTAGGDDGVITISYWTTDRHDQAYLTPLIEEYNKTNPDNIYIDYQVYADNYSQCSATSFLRNWDSILEKKRANLRSISEPARLRQPPPRSTGAAHARGRAQSIREERRIAAPPVLFALLWVRLLPALYGPFCGPLRPFGGCPWGVTPPARECLPPAPPDTRRRG